MSLGDLLQGDIDAALGAMAKAPPPPPKIAEPKWNGWSAPLRGPTAGFADVLGSTADTLKGFGAGAAIASQADPASIAAMGRKRIEDDAAEAKRQIDSGEALTSAAGKAFRDVSEHYRPDPATAGVAEQLVFEGSRVLTKIVGAAVAAGPIGVGFAGAEEGFTQADALMRKGVDPATRTKVGALTAAATVAGAFIPVAGQTVAQTAGLVLAGGPAAFMAQQQLTRGILERANYAEIAQQYDPLDPVGLAVSTLIPAAFGGMHLRGMAKAAPKQVDAATPQAAPVLDLPAAPHEVDAAMTHNLTLLREKPVVHEATIAAETSRGPVTENPNFRAWFGASKVVDEAGNPLVVYHGTRGDVTEFDAARVKERFPNSEGIYFTTLPNHASSYADSVQNAAENFNPASRFSKPVAEGANVVPAYVNLRNPKTIETKGLLESVVDGDNGATVRAARADGFDGVIVRRIAGDEYDGALVIAFEPTQIKSAIGNSGKFDPASPSLTDQPAPKPAPIEPPAAVKAAQQEADKIKASGKDVKEHLAESDLPPDVQNLVIGLTEAADDGARARMVADFMRTTDAQKGRPAADIAADVVDAARKGKTATPEPTPPEAPTGEPAAISLATRVAEVEQTSPDMVVRVDEDGKAVTVADELQRIRREAAEGTDDSLGALDADLVKVAADCALSLGA